jgi:hypothetical protein
MGRTYRKQRDSETTRGRNKSVDWQEKSIDKHKKLIYNKASSENEDVDYDFDDDDYNDTINTTPIQRK